MFPPSASARKPVPGPATVYFLDWVNTVVLAPDGVARAQKLFAQLISVASPCERLRTTPQTPPFHAEGDMVADHVIRMLAGLDAFEHGASLAHVEEFAREKEYVLEFQALEDTLRTQSAFLAAYTLCHDIAKPETVYFEAQAGGAGAAEGFATRDLHVAGEPEKIRYDKLRRAHEAKGGRVSFYEAYGIVVHYPEHGRLGAADEYATTRQAVLDALAVPAAKAKLFTELIRCHLDVIHGFNKGPDPVRYLALSAIVERAGLNAAVFLDLLPATLFLDAILGSLVYVNGTYSADLHIVLNLFKSEREAKPERHAARLEALRRHRKLAVREALQTAGIDAETVFDLLKTPHGPIRGELMAKIHDLIREPDSRVDFGEQTPELRRRARLAHDLLAARQLPLE